MRWQAGNIDCRSVRRRSWSRGAVGRWLYAGHAGGRWRQEIIGFSSRPKACGAKVAVEMPFPACADRVIIVGGIVRRAFSHRH